MLVSPEHTAILEENICHYVRGFKLYGLGNQVSDTGTGKRIFTEAKASEDILHLET